MVMGRRSFGLLLLLLIAFASHHDVAVRTEARVCESQSHGFKGACLSGHNCALVCRNEGFSGGKCTGARRRCFCTKHC
ncbi:defensin-like protein 1 [Malania oleifera]|uniref:defensin-like protein 1 n=1 Tax=Malania oleifera TaxID=397392 RepID=UPI0025AE206A|nr:defensin-like protein 1 [Malania oleifera]